MALAAALQEIHRDEEASAQVEFLVLLPVYFLMIIGLLMFGNLALARQSLVTATQLRAWDPTPNRFGDGALEGATFGPNQRNGDFTTSQTTRQPAVTGRGGQLQDADLVSGGSPGARRIALNALNNVAGNGLPFVLSRTRGEYRYFGIALAGVSPTQGAASAVLLPRNHQREIYQPGQPHPVVALQGAQGGQQPVDPSQDDWMPMGPEYERFIQGGFGIWDTDRRINGSLQNEWNYYDGGGSRKPMVDLGIGNF